MQVVPDYIHQKPRFLMGVDGGGTKTCVVLTDLTGNVLAKSYAGSANVVTDIYTAKQSIHDAVTSAFTIAHLNEKDALACVACLGLAGEDVVEVNLSGVNDGAKNGVNDSQLLSLMPWGFQASIITTDSHIACVGAHSGEDGAIVITGTGSGAWMCLDGDTSSLGGYGFVLGDQASGAWLGREALRSVIQSHDQLASPTRLTQTILSYYRSSFSDLIAQFQKATPAEFAQIAPWVFELAEAGDDTAKSIIQDGAQYVTDIIKALIIRRAPRISMLGGVAQPYRRWLSDDVLDVLSESNGPPEFGAICLAKQYVNTHLRCT